MGTGNKSNISSALWQPYFTKLHQHRSSQTIIFSRQESSDPFNHCSRSMPLPSVLKNSSTSKHRWSERTAFDCRHCYELRYPVWRMAFLLRWGTCAKEGQWTLASPSTYSEPEALGQRRSGVSRHASLLLQSELSWSNYSGTYSKLVRQNFH